MFDHGIANEFEEAHQKGLSRGFDLGWTYKGQFDRSIIRDHFDRLEKKYRRVSNPQTKLKILSQKDILHQILREIELHPCNKENIYK